MREFVSGASRLSLGLAFLAFVAYGGPHMWAASHSRACGSNDPRVDSFSHLGGNLSIHDDS